ncbi:MAG: acyloxyacyl hydrolase, partial [Muribaculaceae bacterium]|nr:acyloxyacyl hydrolase [Muribaculaceae bacterium]
AGLKYRLSNSYSLYAGLDITHYSNGNTAFPNPGVNSAGLRVGIEKRFGQEASGTPFEGTETGRHISCDIVAYGAWRHRVYRGGEEPVLLKGHFPVAGLGISPMWDMKKWLRVGMSADFQWDSSSDLKDYHISGNETEDIRFGHPPFFSQVCGGLALRGELVMPLFSVNVGIGYNLFGPEESRSSYQMANLRIRLPRSFFINIGYQLLDFQRQNNLMLGVGYTICSSSS